MLLDRFRRLSSNERRLIVRVTVLLMATRIALACLPFHHVRRLLRTSPLSDNSADGHLPIDRSMEDRASHNLNLSLDLFHAAR